MRRTVLVMVWLAGFLGMCFFGQGSVFSSETKITVLMQEHSATMEIQKMLPGFEKEAGVNVELIIEPFSKMKEMQRAALTAGNPVYDVVMLDYRDVAGYGEAGWMLPLIETFIGSDTETDSRLNIYDFMMTGLEGLKWKKRLYGLPIYIESTMLMYRKDLYKKHNLSVPRTWEELYENAKKLNLDTDNDGKTDFYGFTARGLQAVGYNDYIWNGFLKSYGGKYFDDAWKPIFNSEAGVKALEMYVRLLNDCAAPSVEKYGYKESMQEYLEGKTAHVIDATMLGAWIEDPEKSKVMGKNGYAIVPKGSARRGNNFFLMGLGIPASSTHQKAAFDFIVWATSSDIQKRHISNGAFMTRTSVISSKEFAARWPFSDIMLKSLGVLRKKTMNIPIKALTHTPILPEWNEVAEQVSQAIHFALVGKKTPKLALDDAAKEVSKIMEKAGYYH